MRVDLAQLQFIDARLRDMATRIEVDTGLEFTVTSLYRIGDTGVHGQLPLRGVDLRMRSHATGGEIVKKVNSEWEYDPERPGLQCAVLHGEGDNLHIHLQVHPRTVQRGT